MHMSNVPMMPTEYIGCKLTGGGYTETTPRKWTPQEIDWILSMQKQGFTKEQIARSVGRSATSVKIKLKRLSKSNGSYNSDHVLQKYALNKSFVDYIKPKTVLDLYCGEKSFYKDLNVTTNDIDKSIDADYHEDAFKLICKLYSQNKRYDLIDLDPYGSAYDCFDLAIKMARKGLVITLGELGHIRWKRLDFVSSHYGIDKFEDFTIENIVNNIQKIGERNKKRLTIWECRKWRNIGRVYFTVSELKITEQWKEKGEVKSEKAKDIIQYEQLGWEL